MDVIPGAVTFVPYNNTFYVGSLESNFDVSGRRARDYEPIGTFAKVDGNKQATVQYSNYEMLRRAERASFHSGNRQADVSNTSLANITRVELLTAIRNEQYKEVYLRNGADIIPVPKLKLDYDVILHVKTRGKDALVPKRQKPEVEAPDFVQANFDLANFGKLARNIDVADEDELSALISPTQKSIQDISLVMSQDENLLILDEMDKFTAKAKASWSALNTNNDYSLRSPLKDIQTERKRITKNHGRTNVIAMNSLLWADFVGNTYVKGYEQLMRQEQPGLVTFDKLPGLQFIIDEDIADGVAYIYDKRALTIGEGPMVSESYRDPQAGVSGHVIRKWVQPLIETTLQSAFGSKMTGL
jgi:hypothetical protein